MARGRLRRHPILLALLIYSALAVALFSNTWRHPGSANIGVFGDAETAMWSLAWGPFAVAHLHNPFYSTYLIAPVGANLMWNTPPLPGLLAWPFTALLGLIFTYNLLLTLSLALSAWCMFLALRRIIPDELGALAGGLLYGFSPYMTAHALGHLVLTLAMVPPLMLIAFHEALVRQRWGVWRTGGLFGVLAAAQLMTFPEMLASEALAAAVGLVPLLVCNSRLVRVRFAHAARSLLAGLVVFLVVAGPALRTMFFGSQGLAGHHLYPPGIYVNDALNFVTPTGLSWVAPDGMIALSAQFTGDAAEWNAYLGLPLLLLLVVATIRLWSHVTIRVASLSALGMAILSLGPHLHIAGHDTLVKLPGLVLEHLPLLGNLLPARLALFTSLFASMILAAAVARMRTLQGWGSRSAAAAVLIGSAVAIVPALPYPTAPISVPDFFTGPAVQRLPAESIVLIAPFSGYGANDQPDLWQAESGFRFRMPEGYIHIPEGDGTLAGPHPLSVTDTMVHIGQGSPRPILTATTRAQLNAEMAHVGVSTVIVGPMPARAEMVGFFDDLLGARPEHVGGVDVWWTINQVREGHAQ